MSRVAVAIVLHELQERSRDRWVLVVTGLFALLATGISAYGSATEDYSAIVTGPSLVTMATFLVPLVALVLGHEAIVGERERHTLGLLLSLPVRRSEVLLSKYIGRLLALGVSLSLGLGLASLFLGDGQRQVVLGLIGPTLLLGAAFLSVGVWISTACARMATAACIGLATWFMLVFIYDLALLAALVVTDGSLTQEAISWAVSLNPAGLYRTSLMAELLGESSLEELGLAVALPGTAKSVAIWLGWICIPLAAGSYQLQREGSGSR